MTQGPGSEKVQELARGLRMLLLDVDGVLTDGGIILMDGEGEVKRFDVHDGMGVSLAQAAGLKVGIITARSSQVVLRRASELDIEEVFQGVSHKGEALDLLLKKYGFGPAQVAYIGDDLPDIPIMKRVGFPIAVQNAVAAVKECSVYVTGASGGHGAVREAVERILELRGDREMAYRSVTG